MAKGSNKYPRPRESITRTADKHEPDWWIFISALCLTGIGIIMVFSASQYFTQFEPYNDTFYYLKRQAMMAGLGLLALFLVYRFAPAFYRRITVPVVIVVMILLAFMALSSQLPVVGGASRWLEIAGIRFQPSELTKVALPMGLAAFFAIREQDKITSFSKGFLPSLLAVGIVAGLILMQKDLSSALVVAAAGFIVMFCAGIRWPYLIGTAGLGVAAVIGAIIVQPYRLERVTAWLDPWSDTLGSGLQAVQSLMALGNGGLTGVGLGAGGSKWFYLPERHTDFIFSVIGEELGFIGCLLVIILFAVFIWRSLLVAVHSRNAYNVLLAIGLTSCIAVQAFINLGVVSGLLPVTGITLPFVSSGGTSLIMSLVAVGMLLNLSRYTEKR